MSGPLFSPFFFDKVIFVINHITTRHYRGGPNDPDIFTGIASQPFPPCPLPLPKRELPDPDPGFRQSGPW